MNIGPLRHKLIFQLKTETQDSFGSIVETWADDFIVPCEMLNSFSLEIQQARKRNSLITTVFRIRYRSGINADMHRVKFTLEPNSSPPSYRTYNIFPPRSDNKRRETLIDAQAIE